MENQPSLPSCTAATRAMDIYEIRTHVGQYLNCQQKAICTMVSRAWRDTLSTMMYLSVDLSAELDILKGESDDKLPPANSIRLKGGMIKDLTFGLPSSYIRVLLSSTRNLQHLRVLRTSATCPSQNGPGEVRSLLEYNPSLQRLELNLFQGPAISTALRGLGENCIQLKHLSFVQSNLSLARLSETMVDAPQITSLYIDRCSMCGFDGRPRGQPTFPHLESLEVVNSGNHLNLLAPSGTVGTVEDVHTFHHYPRLTTLTIRGQINKKKSPIPPLLIQCPLLTELTLHGSPLLEQIFDSLANRFNALTKLDFLDASLRSPSMGDKILWSCPQLVYFGYPSYSEYQSSAQGGYGFAEPRVWTCSGLETLKFKQITWSRRASASWNERVLEQLSTLTELKVFEVGSMSDMTASELHEIMKKWPELKRFPCLKSGLSASDLVS